MARDQFQENLKLSYESVLNSVRSSSLNFTCQETPYSFYITLRKSFTKSWNQNQPHQSHPPFQTLHVDQKLQQDYRILQQSYNRIKDDLEDSIFENESNHKLIDDLRVKLKISEEKDSENAKKSDALKKSIVTAQKELKLEKERKEKPKKCDSAKVAHEFNKSDTNVLDVDVNYNVQVSNQFALLSNLSQTPECSPDFEVFEQPNQIPAPSALPSTPSRSSSAAAESPTPRTPPPFSLLQLKLGFRNFLSDYKDKNNEVKYLKLLKEMIIYNSNMVHIPISDICEFNQHLGDIIRSDYMSLYSSLCCELANFVREDVGDTSGREFYVSILLKHD